MKNKYFSIKNIALMAVFGCVSSLVTLTTAFIPAPLPGLYAIIAIPVGTILILTVVEIVGKFGAATFTQLVSGTLSIFLPGGPLVVWIIIPGWCISGLLIDSILHLSKKKPSESRLLTTTVGLVSNVPGDFLIYLSFVAFLGWEYSLLFFLYGFLMIHMILGGITGIFASGIIKKIKPILLSG
jgi:hypothetical protein